MPKINPSLLPVAEKKVRLVTAPVPQQPDFSLHLRQPDFAELLRIQETVTARADEWQGRGDWYPCVPPIAPSKNLWNIVVPTLQLQCQADGSPLSPEEQYSEPELVPIVGRVPAVWLALNEAVAGLLTAAQADLGNASEAGAATPSAPASTTASNTPT